MKRMPVHANHMLLAQWQSTVHRTAHKFFIDDPKQLAAVLEANDVFVRRALATPQFPYTKPILSTMLPPKDAHLSGLNTEQLASLLELALFYCVHRQMMHSHKRHAARVERAAKRVPGSTSEAAQATTVIYVSDDYRTFDDEDLERPYSDEKTWTFITSCSANFVWSGMTQDKAYNSWKKAGNNNINYGVIEWTVPKNGKVAIIGDWGTGMADAKALLADIVTKHAPDAIIHLGDIYYAGETSECENNFTTIITDVFKDNNGGTRIPFFAIPGNHEYYSYGNPFFAVLPTLNSQTSMLQEASYFCLKVQNTNWQFLAMDTGYDDGNPFSIIGDYSGPKLRSSEAEWHVDKLNDHTMTTILLSHHQLFSANAQINNGDDYTGSAQYFNNDLYKVFQPFFADRIAAWIWGHEHNMGIYDDGLAGLAKGRLVGASAFQETLDEDPYTVNCTDYPYQTPVVQLATNQETEDNTYTDPHTLNKTEVITYRTYYDHSYTIVDFANCNGADDPVTVTYYDYPSWYNDPPTSPSSTLIFTETFSRPQRVAQSNLVYNENITLQAGKSFLGPCSGDYVARIDNYPVNIQIVSATGATGPVSANDRVYIVNGSPLVGTKNKLRVTGTGESSSLKFDDETGDVATWYIKKSSGSSGDGICIGDAIYFQSVEETMYLSHDSHDILNLSLSKACTLTIRGASLPKNEAPIACSTDGIVLQVACENEWYVLTNATLHNGKWYARAISTHEFVANGGAGAVSLHLNDPNVGPQLQVNWGGITMYTPNQLRSNGTIMLSSTETSGVNGMYLTPQSQKGQTIPYTANTSGSNGAYEWKVVKVDTSKDSVIRENDLVYLCATSGDNTYYFSVSPANEEYGYATTSSVPVYCRFSYAEQA